MLAEGGRILLAGASSEMLSLARRLGRDVYGVVDPILEGSDWRGLRVFRDDVQAINEARPAAVILAIDEPARRRRVDRLYQDQRIEVLKLLDGQIDPSAEIGDGTIVQVGGIVTADCVLGRAVRINVSATIIHDARIGDYTSIAPCALILGRATIGPGCYIGAHATVLQNRMVGAGVTVGAGAVVTHDIPDATVVTGVPARELRKDYRWLKEIHGPIVCIVQARMGSRRLPGKPMMPLVGLPMLQRLIERIRPAKSIDRVVVATSTNIENDAIENLCRGIDVECFRGDEDNVLSRYSAIAASCGAKTLVRATGDNPFVDATLIDYLVTKYTGTAPAVDHLSNIDDNGFPYGLYAEVFSAEALRRASHDKSPENLEHVTWALRRGDFRTTIVKAPGRFRYRRLTVDTSDDFAFASQAFETEYRRNPAFGFRDLMEQSEQQGPDA